MLGVDPGNNSGVSNILTALFVSLVAYCKCVSVENLSVIVELIFADDPVFKRLGDGVLLINDFERDWCLRTMARGLEAEMLSPFLGPIRVHCTVKMDSGYCFVSVEDVS
jgi:hypothetical protein